MPIDIVVGGELPSITVRTTRRTGRLVKDAVAHLVAVTTVTADQRESYESVHPSKGSLYIRIASLASSLEVPAQFLVGRIDGVVAEDEDREAVGHVFADAVPLHYICFRRRALSRCEQPSDAPKFVGPLSP